MGLAQERFSAMSAAGATVENKRFLSLFFPLKSIFGRHWRHRSQGDLIAKTTPVLEGIKTARLKHNSNKSTTKQQVLERIFNLENLSATTNTQKKHNSNVESSLCVLFISVGCFAAARAQIKPRQEYASHETVLLRLRQR